MNALLTLAEPTRYKERDIQNALETLWPCLSLRYPLLINPVDIMPSTWCPDMVALNTSQTACLVIELKGIPPNGGELLAIKQVVGYAKVLQKEYRELRVQPVVIGPYSSHGPVGFVHRKSYDVVVVNLRALGKYLIGIAESTMVAQGKATTSPYAKGCLDILFVDSVDTS